VPASNQPEGRRHERPGSGEAGQPVRHAGLPVREQFERLRRAFGTPTREPGVGESGGWGRRRAGRVAGLAAVAFATALAAVILPKYWPGPKFWGAHRNWMHGGVCYYRDFARRDQCLTAPGTAAVRGSGRRS